MPTFPYLRTAAAMALLGLAAGCADDTTAPAARSAPPAPATVATDFPALSRPGDVYREVNPPFGDAATQQFHGGTLTSRLVLYRDGSFALQFVSGRYGFFDHAGSYVRSDTAIAFRWGGYSTAGAWGATGTLRGDTVHIAYNDIMMLSDFVDGDYVRAGGTP